MAAYIRCIARSCRCASVHSCPRTLSNPRMMNDIEKADSATAAGPDSKPHRDGETTSIASGDNAIIPRGQIDPVYEEKARVLNRAVRDAVGVLATVGGN